MMKFIPDDFSFDFMGARKKAFIFSGVLCTLCLAALLFMGLNQGIDFKGGNAVIAAFEKDQVTDQDEIVASMQKFLAEELGREDSQVTVQGFSAGAGDVLDGKNVDRFLIQLEVSTLVDEAKGESIAAAVIAKYGEGTAFLRPSLESDTFTITFKDAVDIKARDTDLRKTFAELGYENISITSDVENLLEIELLNEQALIDLDANEKAGDAEVEGADDSGSMAEYEAKKAAAMVGKTDRRFTVRIQEMRSKAEARLAQDFGARFLKVQSSTSISPSVGKDLFSNGLLAIIYALIGILMYITIRFDFRFAPGAVVALVHDVIVTLGIFAILQVKFSLPIIAALLTIVGYSLNDTIVVLDRVRETFEALRGRTMTDLLNSAINNTLSRTVLTSLTTLMVVMAIFLFGGGQIRDFALALLIGVVIGTYSSVFIASPLVYYMDQYLAKREADQVSRDKDSSGGNRKSGNNKPAKATA